MEKIKLIASRKYNLLSAGRLFFRVNSHKEYEESIILTLTNDGGNIVFEVVDIPSKEMNILDNPASGTYIFPLKKGSKTEIRIKANKAIGSYKIEKKTLTNE